MAGTLESTLASIPGYGGYLAKRKYDEQEEAGDLQKMHTLQSILAQLQQQETMKQFSGAMGGAGTPEQLDAAAMKMAAGGHPGAAAISALADKRRKQTADAATLKTIQSAPAVMPDPQEAQQAADQGTPPVGPAMGKGGLFATLLQSEIPAIANQAKLYQQQANVSDPRSVSPQHWVDLQKQLAAQEASLLERRTAAADRVSNRPEEPLVPIIGPSGKPVLVPRSQAVGKTPAQQSLAGGGEFTDDALRTTAEQYLAGDRQAAQGYARSATARIKLQNEIVKVAKERGWNGADIAAQMADFAGIMSGSRTVGTRAAQIELAASEAQKMIDIVLDKSKGFERTQFVPINQALKAFETQTGQPEVKAFGAAINSLVNVYARAISPSGVPTKSDKEHAREMLAAADSPAQVQAVMDVMRQEMKAARAAPGEVRAATRKAVTGNEPGAVPAAPVAAPKVVDFGSLK